MALFRLVAVGLASALFLLAGSVFYNRIDKTVIIDRLGLAEDETPARKQALVSLFERVGCTGDNRSEQAVSRKGEPNVICTLPGETESTILVGAHFDVVKTSHGVLDNWSGSGLLPSLYQSLQTPKRKHTFQFVGFTDEEKGLIGSRYMVSKLKKPDREKLAAVINIDSIGAGDPNVWANQADKHLLDVLYRTAGALKVPLSNVNIDRVGSTDSEAFRFTKIPRISISSITQKNFGVLHSPMDNKNAVDPEAYYQTYQLLATYLAYLDGDLE